MPEAMSLFEQWTYVVLEWIGFGTVVGLLAKAIMPGRDPGGAVANWLMGIGGCVFGLGAVSYFWGQRITPISPLGFALPRLERLSFSASTNYLPGTFSSRPAMAAIVTNPHFRRRRNPVVVGND